jgi:hypothetical protein
LKSATLDRIDNRRWPGENAHEPLAQGFTFTLRDIVILGTLVPGYMAVAVDRFFLDSSPTLRWPE